MHKKKYYFALALLVPLFGYARVEYLTPGKHRLYGELQRHGSRAHFVLNPGTRSEFEIGLAGAPARQMAKYAGHVAELTVNLRDECGYGCRIDRDYSIRALLTADRLRSYSGVVRPAR